MQTPTMMDGPQRRPPVFGPGTTRWEKEKLAGGAAMDFTDDPQMVGMWVMGETVGKGASGASCSLCSCSSSPYSDATFTRPNISSR